MANSQATNVNKGSQETAPDSECEQLDQNNQDKRAEMVENSPGMPKGKTANVIGKSGTGRGTTVSSMKRGRKVSTAHSRKEAAEFCDGLAEGSGGESNVECNDKKYHHPGKKGNRVQKAGHAEARMIDDAFANGSPKGGSMTFNVDWKPKSKKSTSKMPCHTCHKMMCAAKKCGIKIFLCDKDNKKQELEDKKHCPANKKSYNRLRATMGEPLKRRKRKKR